MNQKCIILIISLFITYNASASYSYSIHDVKTLIIEQAQQQGISPALALAVAKVESDFNAKATSSAGARGVMQIMPLTAEQVFGVHRDRLYDASTNIDLGIQFLKQLLERYNQRLDLALSHYNGGSAVKRADGSFQVIPSTKSYVDKVLKTYRQFDIKAEYSPFYQLVDDRISYNYLVGAPINQISPENENEKNKENENRQSSGLMIKGPNNKSRLNTLLTSLDNENLGLYRGNVGETDWLDSYTLTPLVNRQKKVKVQNINRKQSEKVANYMLDNEHQAKVRQWESIFK